MHGKHTCWLIGLGIIATVLPPESLATEQEPAVRDSARVTSQTAIPAPDARHRIKALREAAERLAAAGLADESQALRSRADQLQRQLDALQRSTGGTRNVDSSHARQVLQAITEMRGEIRALRREVQQVRQLMASESAASSRARDATDPFRSDTDAVNRLLNTAVSLHFEEASLSDVIKHIGKLANISIVLDKRSLDEEGVPDSTPVSIDVDGIQLRSALQLILEQHGLEFAVRNQVLLITSALRLGGPFQVVTYPVADLCQKESVEQSLETLKDLIVATVEPNSWDESGGPGALRFSALTTSLVVRQNEAVHQRINAFLQGIRRIRSADDPSSNDPAGN